MADNVLGSLFSDIANAIRAKTGGTETMTPATFPAKILEIETGESGGGSSEDVRYVTFMSYDGTVEYGKKAVAVGDNCADPIARGVFGTPTRESTVQYDYTFAGWATEANGALNDDALTAVNDNRTVYAVFASVVRYYTISFYDGDVLLTTKQVAYGSVPSYSPTKDGYDFAGWTPEVVSVTEDASYTAVWSAKATFEIATWEQIDAICSQGKHTEYFAIGDSKPVTLTYDDGTSETINFTIVDMDVDKISSTAKAPITLMAENIVSISPVALASGYNNQKVNLHDNDIAKDTLNRIYSAFPSDLQAVIKPYMYDFNIFSGEQHINVFVAHAVNLGINHSGYGNPDTPNYDAKYKHFANGASIQRTKKADSTVDNYWTSACGKYETGSTGFTQYSFVAIDGVERTAAIQLAYKEHGIVPCFCI